MKGKKVLSFEIFFVLFLNQTLFDITCALSGLKHAFPVWFVQYIEVCYFLVYFYEFIKYVIMSLLTHKAIKSMNLMFDRCPLGLVSAVYNLADFSLICKMSKIILPSLYVVSIK